MFVGSLNALLNEYGQQSFSMRLEKHFDDVVRGIGDYSKNVPAELSARASQALSTLAASNPKCLFMASAYSTMLRYDRAARMMNGIAYGVEQMGSLLRRVA